MIRYKGTAQVEWGWMVELFGRFATVRCLLPPGCCGGIKQPPHRLGFDSHLYYLSFPSILSVLLRTLILNAFLTLLHRPQHFMVYLLA